MKKLAVGCAQDTPTQPAAEKAKGEGLGASFVVGGAIVQVEVFAQNDAESRAVMNAVSIAIGGIELGN